MKWQKYAVLAISAVMILAALTLIFSGASQSVTNTAVPATSGAVTINGQSYTVGVIATSGETITSVPSGFDIGVYIASGVTGVIVTANIANENNFGVYSLGSNVAITGSTVMEIGNHNNGNFAPNGDQTGVGIYVNGGTNITIINNVVTQYQKNGITVDLASNVMVLDNTVTGLGRINFNAQNGIQIGWSSDVTVTGNTVSNNFYIHTPKTQLWLATGILLYDVNPTMISVHHNLFRHNQVSEMLVTSQSLEA